MPYCAAAPGDWIALGSNWYAAALIAKTAGFELFTTSDPKPVDPKAKPTTPLHTAIGLRATPTIPPGGAWEGALAEKKNVRAAVNQDMAKPGAAIRAGDEVAFFPPVTGG